MSTKKSDPLFWGFLRYAGISKFNKEFSGEVEEVEEKRGEESEREESYLDCNCRVLKYTFLPWFLSEIDVEVENKQGINEGVDLRKRYDKSYDDWDDDWNDDWDEGEERNAVEVEDDKRMKRKRRQTVERGGKRGAIIWCQKK